MKESNSIIWGRTLRDGCAALQSGRWFLCTGAIIGAVHTQLTTMTMINLRWAGKAATECPPVKSSACRCGHANSAHREVMDGPLQTYCHQSFLPITANLREWNNYEESRLQGLFTETTQRLFRGINSTFAIECLWWVQYHFYYPFKILRILILQRVA